MRQSAKMDAKTPAATLPVRRSKRSPSSNTPLTRACRARVSRPARRHVEPHGHDIALRMRHDPPVRQTLLQTDGRRRHSPSSTITSRASGFCTPLFP